MTWCLPAGLLAAGCASPPADPGGAPRPVVEIDRWNVRRDSEALGQVAQMEIRDPRGAVRFYQVENARGQWLGFIDQAGRVYRREPFRDDERFLGIHTMEDALRLLYEVEGVLQLSPGGAAAEAAAQPGGAERASPR
jgi:hypothetical protein